MPSLNEKQYLSILNEFAENKEDYKYFIETGTYQGETVNNMIPYFDEIYSIELNEPFFNNVKKIFASNDKIKLHLGDSSKVLPDVIKSINGNAIFFLDGHWSGGSTSKGEKDVPLLEELDTIINDFKYKSIIIIDDYRLFGTKQNEDWTDITINNIKDKVNDKLLKLTDRKST